MSPPIWGTWWGAYGSSTVLSLLGLSVGNIRPRPSIFIFSKIASINIMPMSQKQLRANDRCSSFWNSTHRLSRALGASPFQQCRSHVSSAAAQRGRYWESSADWSATQFGFRIAAIDPCDPFAHCLQEHRVWTAYCLSTAFWALLSDRKSCYHKPTSKQTPKEIRAFRMT